MLAAIASSVSQRGEGGKVRILSDQHAFISASTHTDTDTDTSIGYFFSECKKYHASYSYFDKTKIFIIQIFSQVKYIYILKSYFSLSKLYFALLMFNTFVMPDLEGILRGEVGLTMEAKLWFK